MNSNGSTIVALFDDRDTARRAEQDLIKNGFDRSEVSVRAREASAGATTATRGDNSGGGGGFWEGIKDLFGMADDDDRTYYREAANRGGIILSVSVTDEQRARAAAEIVQRHGPVDIDARAKQWREQGWTPPAATAADAQQRVNRGAEAIPVVQEELRVGKRQVQRGGVRVYSRVTERPVEENVNLREERVTVERRPVDRPVAATDAAFKERAIEATETAEEAVVDKRARIVEEVVVNKDVQQRNAKIRDTVRRTDVDVQKVEASEPDDARFRPAYEFADELARDQRYHGRSWDDIETDARTTFEQRHPGDKWDQFKDAVRSRWDRARAKT